MSYTLDKLVNDLLDHMGGKPSGRDVFVQVGDRYYLLRGRPADRGGYTILQANEVPIPATLAVETDRSASKFDDPNDPYMIEMGSLAGPIPGARSDAIWTRGAEVDE